MPPGCKQSRYNNWKQKHAGPTAWFHVQWRKRWKEKENSWNHRLFYNLLKMLMGASPIFAGVTVGSCGICSNLVAESPSSWL